jgi:chemotaxis protein MotD
MPGNADRRSVIAAPDAAASAHPALARPGAGAASAAALAVPHIAVDAASAAQTGAGAGSRASPAAEQPVGMGALVSVDAPPAGDPSPASVPTDATGRAAPASAPVQYLASRIASEASSGLFGASRTAAAEAASFNAASPVKVLHIQLQPADLGTVTVRLSLKAQALQLDLEVGRDHTAHLIQREREALSTLLRSAGYVMESLDVKIMSQGSSPAAGNHSGMQMAGGGQSGSPQADTGSPGARPQQERPDNFGSRPNAEDEQAGRPARRGDIYV